MAKKATAEKPAKDGPDWPTEGGEAKPGKKAKKAKAEVRGPPPGEVVGTANGKPIRRLRVSEIDAAHYNPREIRAEAFEGLKASVAEFGLVDLLVWNVRTQRLVGGHQRLRTLAPDATTDVLEVDLDEVKEKALNLALNNPHAQGEFTVDLGKILDELDLAAPELAGRLALSDLRVDVPDFRNETAPAGFPAVDEDPPSQTECPKCGYSW